MKIRPLEKTEGLRRLLIRLSEAHPKHPVLADKLWQAEAGARGEGWLQKKLGELKPVLSFDAMMDVNLSAGTEAFHLDCLLITRRTLILLESKNIRGHLSFDEKTGEFVRTDAEGTAAVMTNPIYQLEKNKRFLLKWLWERNVSLPVTGAVVITSPNAWLQNVPSRSNVIKLQQVPDLVMKIVSAAPERQASPEEVQHLLGLLQEENTPFIHNRLCDRFRIPLNDLKKRMFCPSCSTLGIRRIKRSYRCEACGFSDPLLHLDAIREYVSFTAKPLTNKKLKTFWNLDSSDVAYRILRKLELETINQNKNRRYLLHPEKLK